MNRYKRKLLELSANNKAIRIAIIGCGFMGKNLAIQLQKIPGMKPLILVDNTLEKCKNALLKSGISLDDIASCDSLSEVNSALSKNKYVITDDYTIAVSAEDIDVVVDCTGSTTFGADIAISAFNNHKDLVSLNVECDAVIGPELNRIATNNNLIYTGTAGDEPGSIKELYDFATFLGFEVLAVGKGKNNPLDFFANPDTVYEKSLESGLKPLRLASFIDGTNTMIELASISNAIGFIPDIRGCHGIDSSIDNLADKLSLKAEGGILNTYNIVDFVFGIAPGVFIIVKSDSEDLSEEMSFLKMGKGPNFTLFRPYHLTSLETPISIAKAYFDREASIAPKDYKLYSEVITVAKKDLKAGEYLDGIGEYTVYGTLESYEISKKLNCLPIGLVDNKTRCLKDIKKGQLISKDLVELNQNTTIYKIRKNMEKNNGGK